MNFFKQIKQSKLAIVAIVILCMSISLFANEEPKLPFVFEAIENDGIIVGYKVGLDFDEFIPGLFTEIVIPEEHQCDDADAPKPVTHIMNSNFYFLDEVTHIVVPRSVTTIEEWAFSYNDDLVSITLPSTVLTIEKYVFDHSPKVTVYAEMNRIPSGWDRDMVNSLVNGVRILLAYPIPPRNLTGSIGYNYVELEWEASNFTDNLSGWLIMRNDEVLVENMQIGELSHRDNDIMNETIYVYTVHAVYRNSLLPSKGTNEFEAKIFYPPSNVFYTANGINVRIHWQLPQVQRTEESTLTGFNVYRDDELLGFVGIDEEKFSQSEGNHYSYTDLDVDNGSYLYEVEAVYGENLSRRSPIEVTFTRPEINVEPFEFDFDRIFAHTVTQEVEFRIRNNAGSYLTINSINITDLGEGENGIPWYEGHKEHFKITRIEGLHLDANEKYIFPHYLANQKTIYVYVQFAPKEVGSFMAFLTVDESGEKFSYDLYGEGLRPEIKIDPNRWDFGVVLAGNETPEKEFTINSIEPDYYLSSIELEENVNINHWYLNTDEFNPSDPLTELNINVKFKPEIIGVRNTVLLIQDGNEVPYVTVVPLLGRSIELRGAYDLIGIEDQGTIELIWQSPVLNDLNAIVFGTGTDKTILKEYEIWRRELTNEEEDDDDGIDPARSEEDEEDEFEDFELIEIVPVGTVSYLDSSVEEGVVYQYFVIAVYEIELACTPGETHKSHISNILEMYLFGELDITFPEIHGNSVSFAWVSPNSSYSFNVYRRDAQVDNSSFILLTPTPIIDSAFVDNVADGVYIYGVTTLWNGLSSPMTTTGRVYVNVLSDDDEIVPVLQTELRGNFPNPFNPITTIGFSLVEKSDVVLTVYNIKGQRVKTLIRGSMDSGHHTVTWNGTDDHGQIMSSGVYFYRMTAGEFTSVRRMILMK